MNKDDFYHPDRKTKITVSRQKAKPVDDYRHKGMRKKLVKTIQNKGIRDEKVLHAIATLPRHFFLDKAFEEWAYEDKPFPIGKDQTISQPFTVAYQTSLLSVRPGDKILEIGTGSGYQAAILSLLGAKVYTIERHKELFQEAKKLLKQLKISYVNCFHGDGFKGLPQQAPFDKILVTAGAEEIPDALLRQLASGGNLVIPVGRGVQIMHRITRTCENEYKTEKFDSFKFVPFLKGTTED